MNLTHFKSLFLPILIFVLSVSSYGLDEVRITSPMTCSTKMDLRVDFKKDSDLCVKGSQISKPKCKKLNRRQILESLTRQTYSKNISKFYLNSLTEYLSFRIHRMARSNEKGRDYCYISLKGQSLKKFIGSSSH